MKYLNNDVVLAFIKNIEEESRIRNDGEVSYAYQAGMLKQMLINSLSSEVMRNALVRMIEEEMYIER